MISVRNASSEEIKKYREANYFELSDRQSVKILHKDGRAFPPGTSMLPLYNLNTAEYFPAIKAVTLDGKDVEVPESYNANVKLVGVSFQGYGYELLTSWLDPFCKKYPQGASDNSVKTIQVCWNKYRFLSLFKNFFIRTIKSDIDPVLHNQTVVTFENMTVSILIYNALLSKCAVAFCRVFVAAFRFHELCVPLG